MPVPQKRYLPRYTAEDYRQWDGVWELWDGIPIAMTPSPFGPHQSLLAKLTQRFLNAVESAGCTKCDVVVELDWIIDPHTVVRPDLSLVRDEKLDRFIEQPPTLIIEISSASSRDQDIGFKRDLYESEGVLHYLIAETNPTRFQHHILGADAQYQISDLANLQPTFELSKDCKIQVSLKDL